MTTMTISGQRLDPLGGITARLMVIAAAVIAPIVAIVLSLLNTDQVTQPVFEALGIVAVIASGALFVREASPFRAPLLWPSHLAICGLGVAGVALNALGQLGANVRIRDDWGPVTLAILLIVFCSYRSARENLIVGLSAAAVVGVIATLQWQSLDPAVPLAVHTLVAVTPVAAVAAASAGFAQALVSVLLRWRASAQERLDDADDFDVATSVRRDQLGVLNIEVIPFLRNLAESGVATEKDTQRARTLSRELRALILIDAERSWLAPLVRRTSDPGLLADQMTADQRGALRAVIRHIQAEDSFFEGTLTIDIERRGDEAWGTLNVDCVPGLRPRIQLAPYVALSRSVFRDASGEFPSSAVTLRFCYAIA